ncbi:unnamed protein product [Albugo candida]|uniref:Uncharacterized protein n=1 Tax=Albugo candida TaxID=65357 RepID=A0A024GM63_9STRA|nr:unnamed protein product [Albugo candida]|eukprot:CCI47833.1 unnamed protein product [Albugo candida]
MSGCAFVSFSTWHAKHLHFIVASAARCNRLCIERTASKVFTESAQLFSLAFESHRCSITEEFSSGIISYFDGQSRHCFCIRDINWSFSNLKDTSFIICSW